MTTDERLEKLERELGRTKRYNRLLLVGVALVACVAGLRSTTYARPDMQDEVKTVKLIRTEKLEVVDGEGKVRVGLGVDKVGGPALWISDANEKNRVVLEVDKDGDPTLTLIDKNGKSGIILIMNGTVGPALHLFDNNGKPRVSLGVFKDNIRGVAPRMIMLEPNGMPQLMIPPTPGVPWTK